MRFKYPRTYHLEFSPGATSDDKIQTDLSCLKDVVITLKMDGENTTIGKGYSHARSIDSIYHPSRSKIKALESNLSYLLDEDERLCGENLYYKHSIEYTTLEDHFLLFSIWKDEVCLSWEDTIERAKELNIFTVPVISSGPFDLDYIKFLARSKIFKEEHEGFVIRNSGSFLHSDFSKNVVKWVRSNHVQTDEHWMYSTPVINKLSPQKGETK